MNRLQFLNGHSQQIKELYKELKALRKEEKSEWDTPN
jgi:hypothetical protein